MPCLAVAAEISIFGVCLYKQLLHRTGLCLGKAGTLGVMLEQAQAPRRFVSGPCHAPDFPYKCGQIAGFCTVKLSSMKQGNKTSVSCHGVMDEHIKLLKPMDKIIRCILASL